MGNPASFDLNPIAAAITTAAMPISVALYSPGSANPYTILPNVYCLRIDYREGPEPPVARFQYLMDDALAAALNWPSQFEQVWPIDAQGNYVVLNDDRLCVLTQAPPSTPDAGPQTVVLFDGFAQIPQVDLSAQNQAVTFVAIGAAVRLWDTPITSSVWRDAGPVASTDTSGDSDVRVALPCRWNPSDTSIGSQGGYIGNCVATADYTEVDDDSYPVFLDPLVIERGENDTSFWYVSDAMAYLIQLQPAPEDEGGNPYVIYPTLGSLKALLSCYSPPSGSLLNSGDAVETDIVIRDYDATNKAVPDVMAELLRYCGFVMFFFTDTYNDGTPETYLKIVRKDALATATPKVLYLAANGASSLDLAANNVTSLHLARDCNQVVDQWTVETAPRQVEITVYLAPGFEPSSGDVSDPTPFQKSNLGNASAADQRMYRWWIADEVGDGHWNMLDANWVENSPLDLSPIFPDDDDDNHTYVFRYRPGSATLISKDANGKPLKAVLEVSQDGYYSQDPKLEEPAGTDGWISIPYGRGWQLLPDRLGIEVTVDKPQKWDIDLSKQPSGGSLVHLDLIAGTAAPSDSVPAPNGNLFVFRLTTVIEADQRIGIPNTKNANAVTALSRIASPTEFARERSADGKDHFQHCTISPGSLYYFTQTDINGAGDDGTHPLVMRDDTAAALTHAEQLRSAHEFPTLAGSATLPFITDYYQIGDRVKIIQGRNANMQINVGIDQGETPCYPWVTAFAWDFSGDKQQTVIQFSDRRAEPQGV
jgi:hypothetical protein